MKNPKSHTPHRLRLAATWWRLIGLSLFAGGLIFCGSSCSIQRYVPQDEYLLRGARLLIQAPDSVPTAKLRTAGEQLLDGRVSPRWRVWWHYRKKFPLRWLGQRIGRAPTFFSEERATQTQRLLENRSLNMGYFYSSASYEKDTLDQRRAINLRYQLDVGPAYTIDTLAYYFRDSSLGRSMSGLRPESLIHTGDPYRLSTLKAERERLATELHQQGYYYFTADDLEFLADTIGNERGVKLLLRLKDDLPPRKACPQRIARVRVVTSSGSTTRSVPPDTTTLGGVFMAGDDRILRPEILQQAIAFEPGGYYDPSWHTQTIERLASFNTYRYISINYSADPQADSLLRVQVLLTPALRRSAAGEVGAAYNSGRYFGPEFSLQYQNRNLFRGAELLTLQADVVYNFFLGPDNESRIPRSGIFGLEGTLQIPRFTLPRIKAILPGLLEAGTYVTLGAKREGLTLNLSRFAEEISQNDFTTLGTLLAADEEASERVDLWQFSLDYGYNWKRRAPIAHRLTVARARYQNPRVGTEELLSLSRSLGFAQGLGGLGRLDRMFLFGPSYDWRYDSRLTTSQRQAPRRHNFLFQLQMGLGFNTVLPVGNNDRQLSREQSNYLRPIADLRHYWKLAGALTLASRLHLGAAIPFTERAIVPYFDLFTVGGPNSLRGFLPRGLGPGITVPLDNNLLGQNGYGNVLAEGSFELRWELNELLQIAGFVDAGNVWLYRTETEPTPGDFDLARFQQELAANVGGGVRIDLSFLLLRLDLAWPVRIPYETNPATPPNRNPRFVLGFGQAF